MPVDERASPMILTSVLAACGGFLLAVLWMDLMFDVQVLRYRGREVPEDILASIAAYYRRVTTDARPMSHLIGAVMLIALGGSAAELLSHQLPTWAAAASVLLVGGPVLLAATRVYPNAVRLATRADTPPLQSALAWSICREHLLCVVGVLAFLAIQVSALWRG